MTSGLRIAGFGAFVADSLVETDREHLQTLFPRFARAAEKQDVGTIVAALDPDLRPGAARVMGSRWRLIAIRSRDLDWERAEPPDAADSQ